MTYAYYHEVKGGKSPKSAPTYQEQAAPKPAEAPAVKAARYVCTICGRTLTGTYCFHHIDNRCCRGESSISNGEARHATCEAWAHTADKRVNPTVKQVNEYRRQLYADAQSEVPTRQAQWTG